MILSKRTCSKRQCRVAVCSYLIILLVCLFVYFRPLMKQDIGWGSRPVKGRDWGNSFKCNDIVIETLVAQFEEAGRVAGTSTRDYEVLSSCCILYLFVFAFCFQECAIPAAHHPRTQGPCYVDRQILPSTWKKTSFWSKKVSWMKPCSHSKMTTQPRSSCEGAKCLTQSISACRCGHQRLKQVGLNYLIRSLCFVP